MGEAVQPLRVLGHPVGLGARHAGFNVKGAPLGSAHFFGVLSIDARDLVLAEDLPALDESVRLAVVEDRVTRLFSSLKPHAVDARGALDAVGRQRPGVGRQEAEEGEPSWFEHPPHLGERLCSALRAEVAEREVLVDVVERRVVERQPTHVGLPELDAEVAVEAEPPSPCELLVVDVDSKRSHAVLGEQRKRRLGSASAALEDGPAYERLSRVEAGGDDAQESIDRRCARAQDDRNQGVPPLRLGLLRRGPAEGRRRLASLTSRSIAA
jgi:hypothetical protein